MKFAFLIFGILSFWSVLVDCDNADIYSGIQDESPFNKPEDDYSPLFPDSTFLLPQMRGSYQWTRERKPTKTNNDYLTENLLQQVEKMLEARREQARVKNFQYIAPNKQILDDARPYAIDEPDSDFAFSSDDVILDNSDANDNYGPQTNQQLYFNRFPYIEPKPWENINVNRQPMDKSVYFDEEDDGHRRHVKEKQTTGNTLSIGTGVFKNVEFVEDPTEFAYLPTDPRYHDEEEKPKDKEKEEENLDNRNVKNEEKEKLEEQQETNMKNLYDVPPFYDKNGNRFKPSIKNVDYGFLTDHDEEEEEQEQEEPPQEEENPEMSIEKPKGNGYGNGNENEMEINVKNRNDQRFGKHHKEFLQQDDVKVVAVDSDHVQSETTAIYVLAIVAGVSAAAVVTLVMLTITWINLQKHVKNASDTEYPAYGVTGPNKDVSPSGDRRLAQSAQMYHYQHQKQQIIALERAAANERHGSISEADSDEENEEGDYTVYECPGLAPTGEMEVKNPMFQDDPTPAQTPQQKQIDSNEQKK